MALVYGGVKAQVISDPTPRSRAAGMNCSSPAHTLEEDTQSQHRTLGQLCIFKTLEMCQAEGRPTPTRHSAEAETPETGAGSFR